MDRRASLVARHHRAHPCGGEPPAVRTTIVPAEPEVWGWLHQKLLLPEVGLLCLYWGFFFYGLGRMTTWFTLARVDAKADLDVTWAGPLWVVGNDLSDAGLVEVLARTSIGGAALCES